MDLLILLVLVNRCFLLLLPDLPVLQVLLLHLYHLLLPDLVVPLSLYFLLLNFVVCCACHQQRLYWEWLGPRGEMDRSVLWRKKQQAMTA